MAKKESEQTTSSGRCGWTNFLYARRDPSRGRAVWQRCEKRTCPWCGPRIRERDLAHDLAMMGEHTMVRRVVAESAWASVRARIKRAGGLRIAVKVPEGIAVYATAGLTGSVVTDLAASWAADYDRRLDGSRIMRCQEWARVSTKSAKNPEGGWGSHGMASKPPAEVPTCSAPLASTETRYRTRSWPRECGRPTSWPTRPPTAAPLPASRSPSACTSRYRYGRDAQDWRQPDGRHECPV
jgi:hypothetical protein